LGSYSFESLGSLFSAASVFGRFFRSRGRFVFVSGR
jgi:hypothetical protein